jgi:hypothetical protein
MGAELPAHAHLVVPDPPDPFSWCAHVPVGAAGSDSNLASDPDRPHIGYLFYEPRIDACARLGPGARPVALTSDAHDSSCGSHSACAGPALLNRERLKGGLLSSK